MVEAARVRSREGRAVRWMDVSALAQYFCAECQGRDDRAINPRREEEDDTTTKLRT